MGISRLPRLPAAHLSMEIALRLLRFLTGMVVVVTIIYIFSNHPFFPPLSYCL